MTGFSSPMVHPPCVGVIMKQHTLDPGLIDDAIQGVEDAIDTILFHEFEKSYTDLTRREKAQWDTLYDALWEEIRSR